MTTAEKARQLQATFAGITDARERLAYIVAEGRRRPPLPPECRTDAARVEGCLANLWLVSEFTAGRCHFRADSDSAVMKGVAVVLCDFYSGQTPEEILAGDPALPAAAGLARHLTPNRRNGLARIGDAIRQFATAHRDAPPGDAA